jgi:hypothetical protein
LEQLEDRAVPAFTLGSAFGFGGTDWDVGHSITTDPDGNVYLTGRFVGTADFDATHSLTATNPRDAFVAKFDSTGACQWVNDLGANYFGKSGVVVQGSSVYVAWPGAVWDGGTLVGSGTLTVSQFDATSGASSWATQLTPLGTPPTYTPWMNVGVAVGPSSGSVYVCGSNYGSGAAQAVVARLDPSTGAAVWQSIATPGSNSNAFATGLAVDAAENVYVSGTYKGTVDFNPASGATANLTSVSYTTGNGANKTVVSTNDAFVWKLTSGGAYVWAGGMGGTGIDYATGIAVDGAGRVNVIGLWYPGSANDFDPGPGTLSLTQQGDSDIFAAHLVSTNGGLTYTAQGNVGGWAKDLGGPGRDVGWGITVDGSGNVYTIGNMDSTPGIPAAFIQEFKPSGTVVATANISGQSEGIGIWIDGSGNVYATGSFAGTANFNPDLTTPAYNLSSTGDIDGYVAKLTQFTPPPPQITISDVTTTEGRSGTTLFVFTVSLSWATADPVTVYFATANGTAAAGSDYQAQSGTLTFAPGETTKTITVVVNGDKTREADESFFVNLSGVVGGTILDGQGLGTILNDD